MNVTLQRPGPDLVQLAADTLIAYGLLRRTRGRDLAFDGWCDILELDDLQRQQLAHLRIYLLQEIAAGKLSYDDIDWSNQDEDRRASSTGTTWL